MQINKILFMTLSNIGDVILTLPVLDSLRANYPKAEITVVSGVRPAPIFKDNPYIHKFIIYDKHSGLKEKLELFNQLRKEKFDLIVDLRNSFLSRLLRSRHKTSPFLIIPSHIKHMRDRHLYQIKNLKLKTQNLIPKSLYIDPKDEEFINSILKDSGINKEDLLIVLAPGARSDTKRWPKENFAQLADKLIKNLKAKIVLVGDNEDASINKYIAEKLDSKVLDLSKKTTLGSLAFLLKKSKLLITNDSAILHLGSYFNLSIIAIFGITNDEKYGPWSDNSIIVKKDIFCRPCEKAQCRWGSLECIKSIKVDDVLIQINNLLNVKLKTQNFKDYKRILIVRTDRIGDVILSTPVIKALRKNYPKAYIAMMVSPAAFDIVDGNPYLDKVIVYDKDLKQKSWVDSIKFAFSLKRDKFDLVIILHPTNRVNLLTYIAGIKKRVGLDKKLGFLLTDKMPHVKQLGQKHELEYNLDLLRYLGIEVQDKSLFVPIKKEAKKWVDEMFLKNGLKEGDKLLVIHPAASCPSKIWPAKRFAEVADKLVQAYNLKVLIVSGPKDLAVVSEVIKNMKTEPINFAGQTSVSQLACILKRCRLFISNDSGPVHLASAVGAPVISIFGRNQPGLSPKRWGPVGVKDVFLHKEIGCVECLAHNCLRSFACLDAISVNDVLSAAGTVLG